MCIDDPDVEIVARIYVTLCSRIEGISSHGNRFLLRQYALVSGRILSQLP